MPTEGVDYSNVVTVDIDESVEPHIVFDLDTLPYPWPSDYFDEIHAYDVLEHCGSQGDWKFFFWQFNELWRCLKPGGKFIFSVPSPISPWVWGDPGHKRMIHPASLTFLMQSEYEKSVGSTAMTDYRHVYFGDFEIEYAELVEGDTFVCRLKAKKSS